MDQAVRELVAGRQGQSSRLSLRTRLMLLVVAGVIPLVLFTLLRGYLDYRDAVSGAGQKTLELARSLALAVEKQQQARIAVLEVLAQSDALRRGDLEAFRARAEAVVA